MRVYRKKDEIFSNRQKLLILYFLSSKLVVLLLYVHCDDPTRKAFSEVLFEYFESSLYEI